MNKGPVNLTQPGWVIVSAIMVLLLMGVASIYVTDTHYILGHDGPANATKQCLRAVVGILLAYAVIRIGHQEFGRYAYSIFIIGVVLLLPLLAAWLLDSDLGGLAARRNGARRWLHLPGLLLQPSEFMKIALVIALAWYLRFRKNYHRFAGLIVPFAASAIPLGLILIQPDLGTALLILPVVFTMLFAAGARVGHLLAIALVGLGAAPLVWKFAPDYQRLRVTSVLLQSDSLRRAVLDQPEKYGRIATKRQAMEWSASSGYQLVHSKNSIGSGGVLGQGWGEGVYVENPLLPDRHNDFVFAIVAHQWGFLGSLVVLACYGLIVAAGVRIASATTEPFARLMAVGLVALLSEQVLVNIGMSVGLLPITGMTLPFVSYGGSSLLCNFVAMGLLISVSRHRPYLLTRQPFVFRREHHEELRQAASETETNVATVF